MKSEPIEKNKDDEVIGGSINGDSSLKVRVTSAGDDSYLSQVVNLVKESQEAKSRTQGLADRAALWLTTIVFDKTGTLTEGEFGVTEIKAFQNR